MFKGFISKDWKVHKQITVNEVIDPNLPEHHVINTNIVRKIATVFSNSKKIEKEGNALSIVDPIFSIM